MTQLRFQGTKVINDGRTSLQLLKYLRHHMSHHRETRRPRYPIPGDIRVYPCPWPDLGYVKESWKRRRQKRTRTDCGTRGRARRERKMKADDISRHYWHV